MATIIIPDKICPHCGGNKWYKFRVKRKRKRKSEEYIYEYDNYVCPCNYYRHKEYYKNYKENKEKRKKREKEYINILSENYIKTRIYQQIKKPFSDITNEEVEYKRCELIKKRDNRKLKSSNKKRKDHKRSILFLSDSYMKELIKQKYGRNIIITSYMILIKRAEVIAFRKYVKEKRKSTPSSIRKIIQSGIMNSGEKISFKNISRRTIIKYRKTLRTIRFYREYIKLLKTI